MNFYEFRDKQYGWDKVAQDDTPEEATAKAMGKNAREAIPFAPHHQNSSAKVIAQYSHKNRILSADEIIAHRKVCRAKPGNCPFEKAVDEADDITPNKIDITKQEVYNRLAAMLTQLFLAAKNLAKPAIADAEKVEEESDVVHKDSAPKSDASEKSTQDEYPEEDTNTDAKIVAEVLEAGINKMVELAKSKGCKVEMDEKKSRYIVSGPTKDKELN